MHFNAYYVLYSHFSHQYVSSAIAAIFRENLLQEWEGTTVVSCVVVAP